MGFLRNKKKVRISFKEEIEPEEILLDEMAQKEEDLTEKRFEIPLRNKSLYLFCFLFSTMILSLIFKTVQLQILEGKAFFELSQRNYQRVYFERSERGVIYDRNQNQLVFNELSFDLVCEKSDLPFKKEEKEQVFKEVAYILKKNEDELKNEIETSEQTKILVAENLDREILILLEEKIEKLNGFRIEKNARRFYPEGSFFSHLIGFVGRMEKDELANFANYSATDYIGKMGVEKSYESTLKGKSGKILVKKDVFLKEISKKEVSFPENGKSLILFMDSDLQKVLSQSLEESIKKTGSKGGAAIALDPKTGGVLSLVSSPGFDNNLFSKKLSEKGWEEIINHPRNPLWNRIIAGTYPTGSTIKPLVALAALEEGIISPYTTIDCQGQISVRNPWFPDNPWIFRDWKIHGLTDMRKAIAESCNVYFYTIGGGYYNIEGLGPERIKKYLELFGWGHLTGIDLPNEKEGLVPDKEWKKEYFQNENEQIWLPGDTYNLSIGQGYLSVTPLEVVSAFSAIANGGKLLKPQVVKQIVEGSKDSFRVLKDFEPIVLREDFLNPGNLKVVREGMREAVTHGSAGMLNDLPVKSAAKTGTAQTGRKDYYHNWITVFAPYEDPEIVLTIVIEDVYEEQVAALPVAKAVLNWYFSR